MPDISPAAGDMPPQYDPKTSESRWYPFWEERGYFRADAASGKEPFCIVLPPPNVTGALHIGHAFQQLLQDIMIRRARMQGFEALWLPGTDHAGIATQVVVERTLREEGLERRDMGRDAFVERVWDWKERFGGRIVEQMKALGNSCDWSRLRFTMDEGLSRAVRVAFVSMYERGLIYRGERLVNWCPTDRTGLSDSEVEHDEVDGELVTFRYPLADGGGHIEVATTRVETMLGDTGIAVHPGDERYRALVGRAARHPFDGRDIPIVADAAVDEGFGTGAVKVTPAHDPNDWEIAERCGLPRINIFEADASLNDSVPEQFRGLDRYEARRRVLAALGDLGLVVSEERPYRHAVGHCYRCHSEIESWVAGKQWFVAVEPLKGPAREAAASGRIRFTPARWSRSYDVWMENLRDWNISRQLWWGHRIPVWYCPDGHETVAVEDPAGCASCGSADIEQDEDVLDTWFSSQLWPFSTLGWPDSGAEDLRSFYPTTALVTGYEILYLWVARMIMSGLDLAGDVPFEKVVIHGLVRDPRGRKMSKSLGNVIDPLDMIERYGADALRFALARMASLDQQNLPLSEEAIEAGRNFANKIWNAARLVLSAGGRPQLPPEKRRTLVERWLLSRHERARREADEAFASDEYASAAQVLHRSVWSEFCDWGLEMEKARLSGRDAQARSDAADTLAWILERTLRLLHPIMPFVTEEIWQRLDAGESIMIAPWPEGRDDLVSVDAEGAVESLRSVITEIRGLRAALPQGMEAGFVLDESLRPSTETFLSDIERMTGSKVSFGRLEGVRIGVRIPEGTDIEPALERVRKRLGDVRDRLERKRRKLANEGFLSKADPAVVSAEREDVAELESQEALLTAQLERLASAGR